MVFLELLVEINPSQVSFPCNLSGNSGFLSLASMNSGVNLHQMHWVLHVLHTHNYSTILKVGIHAPQQPLASEVSARVLDSYIERAEAAV